MGRIRIASYSRCWKESPSAALRRDTADRSPRRFWHRFTNLSALVEPTVGGSRLMVVMELAPRGFLRLMIPVLKRVMQKTEQSNLVKIKTTIEPKFLAGR